MIKKIIIRLATTMFLLLYAMAALGQVSSHTAANDAVLATVGFRRSGVS
jgi:hypothetical protein